MIFPNLISGHKIRGRLHISVFSGGTAALFFEYSVESLLIVVAALHSNSGNVHVGIPKKIPGMIHTKCIYI